MTEQEWEDKLDEVQKHSEHWYKMYSELKAENKELKATIKYFNPCGEWDDDVHDCEFRHYAMEYGSKLTEAREIIRQIVIVSNLNNGKHSMLPTELFVRAENFLKGE